MRKNWFKRTTSALMASVMALGMMVPLGATEETTEVVDDLPNVRFAVSADGNAHDEDDWAATAATLGVISAAGMIDNLVHYDVGSHIWFCEECDGGHWHTQLAVTADEWESNLYDADGDNMGTFGSYDGTVGNYGDQMNYTMMTALELFGYDMDLVNERYFNDCDNLEGSIANLVEEIEKSTADNRLYMILGGPAEVFYMALAQAEQGQDYVTIITHSGWNNVHKPTLATSSSGVTSYVCSHGTSMNHALIDCSTGESIDSANLVDENGDPWVSGTRYVDWVDESHNLYDLIEDFPEVEIVKIDDQNAGTGGGPGLEVKDDNDDHYFESWNYMRDSENEGWNFVYKRMKDQKKSDISDTGMTLFAIKYLQDGIVLEETSRPNSWTTDPIADAAVVYTEYNYEDFGTLHEWLYDMGAIEISPDDVVEVTFDAGSADAINPQVLTVDTVNDTATEPTEPVLSGNAFQYWYADDEDVAFDFNTVITEDTTLTAKWEIAEEVVLMTMDRMPVYTFCDGVAVEGVTLTLGDFVGTSNVWGVVYLDSMPVGTYDGVATCEGYEDTYKTVTLTTTTTYSSFPMVLEAEKNKVDVTVTALMPDGSAAEGATVTLDGETQTVDATGVVTFTEVSEGSYSAVIAMEGKETVTRSVVVDENSTEASAITYMVDAADDVMVQGLTQVLYDDYDQTQTVYPDDAPVYSTTNVDYAIDFANMLTTDIFADLNQNYFAVQYLGQIYTPTEGTYTFRITSNDGYKLVIDGETLSYKTGSGAYSITVSVDLTEGYHDFEMFTYQWLGNAAMKLEWQQPGESAYSVIPAENYFLAGGDTKVITYVEMEEVTLATGTEFADAALPETATVYYSDGSTGEVAIAWTQDDYDVVASAAGTYALSATLVMADGVVNPGDLVAPAAVTFEGELALATTATLQVGSIDVENGTTDFQLVLESVSALKALYVTVSDADAIVTAGEGFEWNELDDGVYMLAYGQGNFDALTGKDILAATFTVAGSEGATLTISNVIATTSQAQIDATITNDTAESTTAFALAKAIAEKVDEIAAAQAAYAQEDYLADDWTTLTAIFTDAAAEVEGMTDVDAVIAYDVDALIAAADAILTSEESYLTQLDINGNGSIGFSDITCIIPYYGSLLGDDVYDAKYDVGGEIGSINSADYLAVYAHISYPEVG